MSRVSRNLDEKGTDQIVQVLFVGTSRIEKEISHRGQSGLTHGSDILDDGGAGRLGNS